MSDEPEYYSSKKPYQADENWEVDEEQDEKLPEGEKEMSFLEHLEELRWHIIRSLISIIVFAIVAFLSKEFVFGKIILGPSRADFWTYQFFCKIGEITKTDFFCVKELPFILQNRQITAQFTLHMTSSFIIGLILAFPYAFWEFWRFISPGLYHNEKKSSRGAVFFVSVLFISGILFGYYVISPISIKFLTSYQLDPSIMNEIDIRSYINLLVMVTLACGLMFQLPMVIYFLTKAGIVTPQFLKTYRKMAIVIILVIAAIITPPDVMSQLLITFPLLILYEISIVISKVIYKKRNEEQTEALAKV